MTPRYIVLGAVTMLLAALIRDPYNWIAAGAAAALIAVGVWERIT
jgi:hypothetical protein